MKKFVPGIAVLGVLAIYSLSIRHHNPIISKPPSLANGSASGPSPPSSSSGSGTPW